MEKLLIGRGEAAAILGISARSVDYLIAKGTLRSRKIGRRRLVPRKAVEQLARVGCGRITPVSKC